MSAAAEFDKQWDRLLASVGQPLDPPTRGGDYRGGRSMTGSSYKFTPSLCYADYVRHPPAAWVQLTFPEILASTFVERLAFPGAALERRRRLREDTAVRLRLAQRQARLGAELAARTTLQARRDREKSWALFGHRVEAAQAAGGEQYRRMVERLFVRFPWSVAKKSTRQKGRLVAEALEREESAILFVLRELGARPNLSDAELLNQVPTCNPESSKGWARLIQWREKSPHYFLSSIRNPTFALQLGQNQNNGDQHVHF